jgi:hypothetical protein
MIQEQMARAGVAVTGGATGVTFVSVLPIVQVIAAIIACIVGLATGTYYVLAVIEKWRNIRKK